MVPSLDRGEGVCECDGGEDDRHSVEGDLGAGVRDEDVALFLVDRTLPRDVGAVLDLSPSRD